jgi:hypothetical protein
VKKGKLIQGLSILSLELLLAKISKIIYPNNTVATTEIKDPKLEIAFQPLKASG